MTTFEKVLQATPKQLALAHEDYHRMFTAEEHEMIDALLAMADDDLPAGSIKVGAPDEIRQTLDDLWASLGTPRAIVEKE